MNPHFFTAPFYFTFIWFRVQGSRFKVQGSGFRVQGSGLRWRLRRLFLEDGILVSQPSPLGEGAPQGRIGHWRYESARGNAYQAGDLRQHPRACFCKWRCPKMAFKSPVTNHARLLIHSDYSPLTPVLWSFAMTGLWMIIFMLKHDNLCFLIK